MGNEQRDANAPADAVGRAHIELQALLNAAVDAIIVIDANGCIETFNPGAEILFDTVPALDGWLAKELPDPEVHDPFTRSE